MLAQLYNKRKELHQLLRDTAVQLEQVRGALQLCEQLIQEAEANDIPTLSPNERQDGSPVG